MKLVALLPLTVFTLHLLLAAISGALEVGDSKGAVERHERRRNSPPGEPEAAPHGVHHGAGRGLVTAQWLLLPLAAVLPLVLSGRNLRRRRLALIAVIGLVAGAAALTLLASFTGFLICGGIELPKEGARESLLRFRALHLLGIPILLGVALTLLWAVEIRLARRVGRRTSPSA